MSSTQDDLIEQVLARSRELSTATVMFHTAIAEKVGLTPVEMKTMDYLTRLGPLTAKELARHSGLRPASVTALVDRLEKKGFVRRRPHPYDGRKVLIEFAEGALGSTSVWDYLIARVTELCQGYSTEQLRVIVEFVTESTEITHRSTARLTDPGS